MLTTRRPTQTTVVYTVSTRSATNTMTAKAKHTISILLRIFTGLFIITILIREYHLTFPLQQHENFIRYLNRIPLLSTRPWRLLFCAAVLWMISRKSYTEESLLVMRGLGVQTTTSGASYFDFSSLWGSSQSSNSTRFIPSSSIQDIWIHEAFRGFEVRFYLCIVVEGEEDVVVVFPSILPRREILEQVWRGARACLYEPKA